MKKLFLSIAFFLLVLVLSVQAYAVPIAINFDPDGTGTNFSSTDIYGWDLEAVAEGTLPGVTGNFDIVTEQSLGADNILNNNDTFTENFTIELLNGLGGPPSYGSNTSPYNDLFNNDDTDDARLYLDLSLDGYITNYNSGSDGVDTTASNVNAIEDDSFSSIFTTGTGKMYVDTSPFNTNFDAGETTVAEFTLTSSAPTTLGPSVFGGGQAAVSIGFGVDSMNTDFFSQAAGFPDPQDLISDGFLLTLTQGGVNLSNFVGDTSTDPDQILLGFQETGFDAKFDAVPEPGTLLLFGTGLLGLAAFGRKKFMKKS